MSVIETYRKILRLEAEAIISLPISLEVEKAVRALTLCKGKVFTTGLGKAGYVARKAASTFSTTGTPSVFLHPADASHGDVGMVSKGDILLAFSNSGKNREVIETVHFCRRLKIDAVIAITSMRSTPLGEEADIILEIGKIAEPCPFGLTPTASTTAMIAVADGLALTTMTERGFTREDFAVRHHGGYLGRKSREEG